MRKLSRIILNGEEYYIKGDLSEDDLEEVAITVLDMMEQAEDMSV